MLPFPKFVVCLARIGIVVMNTGRFKDQFKTKAERVQAFFNMMDMSDRLLYVSAPATQRACALSSEPHISAAANLRCCTPPLLQTSYAANLLC